MAYPQEVDTGLLGAEIGSREAGLLRLREPELDRAVLDRTKILLRVPHDLAILRSPGAYVGLNSAAHERVIAASEALVAL